MIVEIDPVSPEPWLVARAAEIGAYLQAKIAELSALPAVGETRGLGIGPRWCQHRDAPVRFDDDCDSPPSRRAPEGVVDRLAGDSERPRLAGVRGHGTRRRAMSMTRSRTRSIVSYLKLIP